MKSYLYLLYTILGALLGMSGTMGIGMAHAESDHGGRFAAPWSKYFADPYQALGKVQPGNTGTPTQFSMPYKSGSGHGDVGNLSITNLKNTREGPHALRFNEQGREVWSETVNGILDEVALINLQGGGEDVYVHTLSNAGGGDLETFYLVIPKSRAIVWLSVYYDDPTHHSLPSPDVSVNFKLPQYRAASDFLEQIRWKYENADEANKTGAAA